jgi:RimJ/RimL family protein N-acetyltransferase
VVALTDLMVTKGEERASQWSTIVDRDFRGHRLGAAVKAANLRQVLAAHPELTAVQTTNAETNANMIDINERLGFKPIALCPGFLRDL